jgi:phosphohistidine phosphatase
MQRTLVLIRHAKSSWGNLTQSDFERPLNERGEHDAPIIGKRLKELGLEPDLVIASTAKRAKQTAKKIADATAYDKDDIQWVEKLYHCMPPVFEEIIYGIGDKVKTVFIVAHNPGITQFANKLSDSFSIDNMPTCGAVAARMDAAHWNEFNKVKKEVFLFEYPKK